MDDEGFNFDVAIIGGGMAGATLALQLRLAVPDASVALFERSERGSFKVGESTVEIACNYFIRKLGLSNYLYQHQLPKNGLRFFFDNRERNAPLERMTEIGTQRLPHFPAFQIDRAAFDDDLLQMAAARGVAVHRGARVSDIAPGRDGEGHRFQVEDGQCRKTVRARWLVDASGRTRLLQKTLATPKVDVDHRIASAWGRFTGVTDLDGLELPGWRARVNYTARNLSTNHFCYPGYWIWMIPLRGDIVSLGWVGRAEQFQDAWRKPEGFMAMLGEHKALGGLIGDARCIDTLGYGQLAYGTTWFFRPDDRLALVGEAAAFGDPFYSPGADFIALENDCITDMVTRDLRGESRAQVAAMGQRYDRFMALRFDATMLLYRNLYGLIGSRELLQLKWDFDIAGYYNAWLHAYMGDRHLDPAWLDDQLAQGPYTLAGMTHFSRMFQALERKLARDGTYFRSNLDDFALALGRCDVVPLVGTDRSRKSILCHTRDSFNRTYRQAMATAGAPGAADLPDRALFEFMGERPPWADTLPASS